MKFDFVVLGATGEEGGIASKDLLNSGYSVLLCGRNPERIKQLLENRKAKFAYVDVKDVKKTAEVIKNSGAKIVLSCVELKLNLEVMKACLDANAHYLDLGGLQDMTIEQYKLDKQFKDKKLISLLGCGSTPGIANVMAKYAVNKFDAINHIDVGFGWNSNIKKFILPYSIESIVYEFTAKPVIFEKGKFKESQACALEKRNKIRKVGKQTSHCIVHSEVYTFGKYFKNKGLKSVHYSAGFPEHSEKVLQLLIDLGFGSQETIKSEDGKEIKIIDFTREVLKKIKPSSNYKEIENIQVVVNGTKNNKEQVKIMECITKTLKGFEEVGSNVNTGMTISIMAQLILKEKIKEIGVTAPEACVPHEPFFKELAKRKMVVYEDYKRIN